MNKLLLIVCLFLFHSCINSTSETKDKAEENTSELSASKSIIKNTIPSLSFSEIEPYFKRENDTTYVINFWATWCKPCIKELPYFESITENYKDQKVKVVLISLDFPKKVETNLIPFVRKRNIKSEVIHLNDSDANTWIPKVSEEWEGAIPATLIYNKEERKFYERSFTYEELVNELENILN
ncbi:MAG: TlpA family protein disulfide reductase [Flavobacteriaceae bacterium]|nr:TlpA family protein disulfide reductase [Flavobacteriaceae bacterium]